MITVDIEQTADIFLNILPFTDSGARFLPCSAAASLLHPFFSLVCEGRGQGFQVIR